jgi:uncharacterized RmlC-like cupin family protein
MVEGHDGILVIRAGEDCRDWNGIHYKEGLSGKNVGAKALSMNVATIPPGGVAYAHIHVGFEVMLYILEGRVRHEYGDGLKQVVENTAGDFIFIEPGVPPKSSTSAPPIPVSPVARSDASEWANIIPINENRNLAAPAIVSARGGIVVRGDDLQRPGVLHILAQTR